MYVACLTNGSSEPPNVQSGMLANSGCVVPFSLRTHSKIPARNVRSGREHWFVAFAVKLTPIFPLQSNDVHDESLSPRGGGLDGGSGC